MQIYGLTCLYLKDVASSTIKNIHASCHTGGYMKKVIGVAVAASLFAGMAFAEVSVSLNARLRSNMYHVKELENADKDTKDKKFVHIFDLDNKASHGGSGSMSDTLGFNAKTDYAGVQLELAPNGSDNTIKVDSKYNGWLKFGDLKFSFGSFDSRFINRYNESMAESGLLDSDYAKYGLASLNNFTYTVGNGETDPKKYKGTTTKVTLGKDANNFSAVEGTRVTTLIADYTFADVAGGKLLVKAALINGSDNYKSDDDTNKTDKTNSNTYAGFGFEADYQNDSVAIQGLFKKINEDQMIIGAYVEPKGLPFNTVLGFTYASQKDGKFTPAEISGSTPAKPMYKENPLLSDISAYAVDLRFKYKVTDAATIAALAKYESVKVKEADETDTALALGAEVSYVVSDKIGAFFDIMYINADLDDEDNAFFSGAASKVQVRPGVKLTAGKDAAITAAFQYDNYIDSDDRKTKTEYSIPVIFRVKL